MAKHWFLGTLLSLSYLFLLSSAIAPNRKAAAFLAKISTAFLPPSQDPFYTAPAGYESAAPGAVLRVRVTPGDITKVIANCSAAYNILYRTTDSQYQPSWAVTTLLVPSPVSANSSNSTNATAAPPGSYLLSYQTPYDSANVDLSPSYTIYASAPPDVASALGKGWYVNIPDYEGPKASFTAGVQSGHATLDAIRVVLNSGFGLSLTAKYALWGYSGGALASEWAAELQVQYAPELSFAGVALGGLTPNVTSVVQTITGTSFAELIVNGVLGLSSQFPDAEAYLLSQLKPSGPFNASTFLAARNESSSFDAVYNNQDIFNYFIDGRATLQSPILQYVTNRDGIMGYHGVPAMPVFAYKAIGDEISAVADTDKLINRYCEVGANILYQRNTVGGHVAEFINGDQRAVDFLTAVFDGTYASKYNASGCTIQNVTVAIANIPE